jgi:hypothetical protein
MRPFAASALACTSSSGATTRSRIKRTSSSRESSVRSRQTAPCRREAPDRAQEGHGRAGHPGARSRSPDGKYALLV